MDLVKMDVNRQPSELIDGYDSLIWTERFSTCGDFVITTGRVDEFMTKLPEGTVLTLRESTVPMIVETHEINRKKNAPQSVTIRGRSYQSILDRRAALKSLTDLSEWTVNAKIPSDAAYYAIVKVCVDGIVSAADIFPGSIVTFSTPADYLTSTGPTKSIPIPRGNLLAAVESLLQTATKADPTTSPATPAVVPHGIRAVRPGIGGTVIAIEIYTGVDRTATVRFEATRDMLDDGNYVFSKVGSANVGYILGNNASATLSKKSVEPTGLDRRVLLIDASSTIASDAAMLRALAEPALSEASETAIFDGTINQDLSTFTYGSDYGLGDIVQLVGDYGLVSNARVTEYIRSEDATGVKAYPTLTAV